MKTFEMPKMNVAIFSLEDVVTTSITSTNIEEAKNAIKTIDATATDANITVTTAENWINA